MRYLFVLAALAGCATQEEQTQTYVQALRERCDAYGFSLGTEDFRRCMMALDLANQNRKASDDATNLLLLQEAARGLNQPPIVVQPQPQTPTLTNCVQRGNRLECKSF